MSATTPTVRLSVIVPVHAEGRLVRPTLRSISAGFERLRERDVAAELVIVADGASAATFDAVEAWRTAEQPDYPVRILDTALGSPGAARNAGVDAATGEYIVVQDGDDLLSDDFYVNGLDMLEHATQPLAVHPEVLITFGARRTYSRFQGMSDPKYSYRDLLEHNLWSSALMTRRNWYLDTPQRALRPGSGVGPEDWLWHIETIIAGVRHEVVSGSIHFYRTRRGLGVNAQNGSAILPWFDIQSLRERFARQAPTTGVTTILSGQPRPSDALQSSESAGKPRRFAALRSRLPLRLRHSLAHVRKGMQILIDRSIRFDASGQVRPMPSGRLARPDFGRAFALAADLEPALSNTLAGYHHLEEWSPKGRGYGFLLDQLMSEIGADARALVVVPWVGIGGADLVSRNYMKALVDVYGAGRVVAVATYVPERTLPELIPDGVRLVHVPQSVRTLSSDEQHRFFAQFVILSRAELLIGVNCFDLVLALGQYPHQIADALPVYLTLFAWDQVGAGYPTNPITDDPGRQFLNEIAGLITDNTATKARIDRSIGTAPGFVRVHPQPALDDVPELDVSAAAFTAERFDAQHPLRLVWPHRLDPEKRPDVLLALGREIVERDLPVRIDVWGQRILGGSVDRLLGELGKVGVVYRGPYSGGLSSLPMADYHALLLTSEWEGLPLVLVQSMLLGTPVIATAVGGVPDLVRDRETGYLVSGPDDTSGFMAAIEAMLSRPDERQRIVRAGHSAAAQRHSWEGFREQIVRDFGLERP